MQCKSQASLVSQRGNDTKRDSGVHHLAMIHANNNQRSQLNRVNSGERNHIYQLTRHPKDRREGSAADSVSVASPVPFTRQKRRLRVGGIFVSLSFSLSVQMHTEEQVFWPCCGVICFCTQCLSPLTRFLSAKPRKLTLSRLLNVQRLH